MNNNLKLLFAGVIFSFSLVANSQEAKKVDKTDKSLLCVGNYWTESQGKSFLETQRQKYTSQKEWESRAQQIRQHILKGTGLEKFPKKCPLNAIIGEKRVYDGYQVQNVAFESLPGVYVTGSLYTPTTSKGNSRVLSVPMVTGQKSAMLVVIVPMLRSDLQLLQGWVPWFLAMTCLDMVRWVNWVGNTTIRRY